MKGSWRVLAGTSVLAAALAAGSSATTNTATGDTCTVSGSGTTYTVTIMVPANGPEQGAFAIDATGRAIAKVDVSSSPGTFSSTGGPGGKSAAWVPDAGIVPGASVVAAVTTSAALTGSNTITLTPASSDRTSWFDPVVCSFPKGATIPKSSFTVQKKATYSAVSGTWREAVTLPGPGKVNFVHKTLAATGTPRPLIKSGRLSVGKAGQVMLTLRPTVAGAAVLSRSGAIKLNLNIEYSPTNGKPANKVVSLTLRK